MLCDDAVSYMLRGSAGLEHTLHAFVDLYAFGHVQLSMHGKLQWENPVTHAQQEKSEEKSPIFYHSAHL